MYRRYLPWYIDPYHDEVCIKKHKNSCFQNDNITLLNWNVHKNNHKFQWLHDFHQILHTFNPSIISFQEYQTMSKRSIIDKHPDYGYGFLPNISYKHHMYGLLTAAKSDIYHFHYQYSEDVEPIIKTPKVSFLSRYKMNNGETINVINVHMINFVKMKKYMAQIKQIEKICVASDDAIILTGDFNTWSRKRMHILRHMTEAIQLDRVPFIHEEHKKSFLAHPLDHVYYRGLEIRKSQVLKEIASSDHKPLVIHFKLKGGFKS